MMSGKIHANNFNFAFTQNGIKKQIKKHQNKLRKTAQKRKKSFIF